MTKKSNKKKLAKIILYTLGSLTLLLLLSFVSTLSLETRGMRTFVGEYVTVYYEKEETAAREVFELVNAESERLAIALGFDSPQDINIFIYDNQSTFQTKKYGFLVLLFNLDWYVGDNRGTNVTMTSPANPGRAHDWDSIVQIAVHEMVHAYNSILNRNMRLWIDEGLATYLSKQNPREWGFNINWYYTFPALKQTQTANPLTFESAGGYNFSYTYIEFLDELYGWDNVLVLARTNNFEEAFGRSESDIYDEWLEWLSDNYGE